MKKKMKYNKYKKLRDKYEGIVNLVASLRLIIFIVMIVSFILKYYYYELFFMSIFIVTLITFIILVIVHDRYYKVYDYYNKYMEVIEEYIKRSNGEWKKFVDTGACYLDENNVYLKDLNVLGDNSLYQLLCVASTRGGKNKLVNRLSNHDIENLEMEQETILELSNNIDFCVDYQVNLYDYRELDVCLSESLDELVKGSRYSNLDFIFGVTLSIINVVLLLLGLFRVVDISLFYFSFMISFMINYLYSYIYRREFKRIDKIVNIYSKLYGVFNSVVSNNFVSEKLICIRDNIENNYDVMGGTFM